MKHSNLKFVLPALAAGLAFGIWGLVTTSSNAQTANANLVVTATVPTECTIAGAAIPFGNYIGSISQIETVIDVTCQSESTVWAIGADAGQNASGCIRRMTDELNNFLVYELFVEPNFTSALGSGDGGLCDNGIVIVGAGSLADPPLFGQIEGGQNVPPGNYFDTVVMTISF